MSSHPTAIIELRHLVKRYGSTVALNDVSFELRPGEIFGLLGQNGAGKTTTLECLLGLRQPDSGSISINGVDVLQHPHRGHAQIGAQLQSAAMQDKITPREALRLFASFHQKPSDIDNLLARFSLKNKAREPFASLSGGQKQRFFLALALVGDPKILILDEPTAGLDPHSRRDFHLEISKLKSTGKTVLLSTHNMEEAAKLCDRIGILHHGRMVALAAPTELIATTRTNPRVSFCTARPLTPQQVAGLPETMSHKLQGDYWLAVSQNLNRTICGLMQIIESERNDLLDLQIQRATLEDVFIELTGQTWQEKEEEAVV